LVGHRKIQNKNNKIHEIYNRLTKNRTIIFGPTKNTTNIFESIKNTSDPNGNIFFFRGLTKNTKDLTKKKKKTYQKYNGLYLKAVTLQGDSEEFASLAEEKILRSA
jgi:molybdopterin synthase catalytic subunit